MKTNSHRWLPVILLIAVFVFPLLIDVASAEPSRHTANYVKGRGELLVDREVSVDVAWLQPMRWADDDYTAYFLAFTWDEREKFGGGVIFLAVSRHHLERFLDKYGTSPDLEGRGQAFDLDSRRLTAVLRSGSDGGLYLDKSDGGAESPTSKLRDRIEGFLSRLRSQGDTG